MLDLKQARQVPRMRRQRGEPTSGIAKPVDLRLPPGAASARLGAARLAELGYRNAAAAYEVTASQIATHSPSDKSNITIKEAAVLSRGARSSAV